MVGSFEVAHGLDMICISQKTTHRQLSISFRLFWEIEASLS
jgi:hypothetical protein